MGYRTGCSECSETARLEKKRGDAMLSEALPIPGCEGYFATADGLILSTNGHSTIVLKSSGVPPYGHLKVYVGSGRYEYVHRLVLRTFVREPSDSEVTRHLDGNPNNNKLANLCWGTVKENSGDRDRHGKTYWKTPAGRERLRVSGKFFPSGEKHPSAKLTDDLVREMRVMRKRDGTSYARLAQMFHVSKTAVCLAVSCKNWKHVQP